MENQKPQRINSQQELDELLKEKKEKFDAFLECFILLNYGLRNSVDIYLMDNGNYHVIDECDGSEEVIRHDDFTRSYIREAIQKGALYKY